LNSWGTRGTQEDRVNQSGLLLFQAEEGKKEKTETEKRAEQQKEKRSSVHRKSFML